MMAYILRRKRNCDQMFNKVNLGSVFTFTFEIKTLAFSSSGQKAGSLEPRHRIRPRTRTHVKHSRGAAWVDLASSVKVTGFLVYPWGALERLCSWLCGASFCSWPPFPHTPSLFTLPDPLLMSRSNPLTFTVSLHVATFAWQAPVLPLSFPFLFESLYLGSFLQKDESSRMGTP